MSAGGGFAQSSGGPVPRGSGDDEPDGGLLSSVYADMVRRAASDGTEIRLWAMNLREMTTVLAQSSGPPTVEEDEVALSRLPLGLREFANLF